MPVHKIKKYKIIKDENGNQIKVLKSKKQWDKETCKGTKLYYFEDRYDLPNGTRTKYISRNFEFEREAKNEETIFLNNPMEYIKLRSKKKKKILNTDINNVENKKNKSLHYVWTKLLEDSKNRESTLYSSESGYNCHIKNFFEKLNKNINLITKEDIKSWKSEMDQKKMDNGKNYKLSYKKKMFSILSTIFEYAFEEEYIETNILDRVKNFQEVDDEIKDNDIRYQTLEEFEQFVSVIDDKEILWKAFFEFTFWHGPREGEEQALIWKDLINKEPWLNVDKWEDVGILNNLKIKFFKTFSSKVRGGGHKITNTKNKKNATVPVASRCQKSLFYLYKHYYKLEGFSENWFIFGGPIHISMSTMRRRMNEYYNLMDAKYYSNNTKKVNRLTHHEFGRHSIATYLRNRGAKPEDVAEYLRDTVEVIEKTYYHSYTEERLNRIQKLL